MQRPKIKNVSVSVLKPNIVDKEILELLPKTFIAEEMTFELENASVAFTNALRRVIVGEVPTKCLTCNQDDIVTNDIYIKSVVEFLVRRIRLIPINQEIPESATFEIAKVENGKSSNNACIYTDKIHCIHGFSGPICNENLPLIELHPNCNIRITEMRVETSIGSDDASHVAGIWTTYLPIDQKPFNPYTKEGIHASVANPRAWKLGFMTNGNIGTKKLLSDAIYVVQSRLNGVKSLLVNIITHDDVNELTISNETSTIGNLFMKTALELHPELDFVNFAEVPGENAIVLRLRGPVTIFKEVFDYLLEAFDGLL